MEAPGFQHLSVLLEECVEALSIREDGFYIDVTAGGAGHSAAILKRLGPGGRLLAMDRDLEAVAAAEARLKGVYGDRADAPAFEVVHAAMSTLSTVVQEREGQLGGVDGILADLGVSSHQLSTAERGFSFAHDGPLDMRRDPTAPMKAADLLASLGESELVDLIRRFGEDPAAPRIARKIVAERDEKPIQTTAHLAELVQEAYGRRARESRVHPATRTFQALRIAVNDELSALEALLSEIQIAAKAVKDGSPGWLAPHARIAVIGFHSLEDRRIKQAFAAMDREGLLKDRAQTPRIPSDTEIASNPRARSAKLRCATVGAQES